MRLLYIFILSNFQTVKLSKFESFKRWNLQTFKLSNDQTFKLSNFQTLKLCNFHLSGNPWHPTRDKQPTPSQPQANRNPLQVNRSQPKSTHQWAKLLEWLLISHASFVYNDGGRSYDPTRPHPREESELVAACVSEMDSRGNRTGVAPSKDAHMYVHIYIYTHTHARYWRSVLSTNSATSIQNTQLCGGRICDPTQQHPHNPSTNGGSWAYAPTWHCTLFLFKFTDVHGTTPDHTLPCSILDRQPALSFTYS